MGAHTVITHALNQGGTPASPLCPNVLKGCAHTMVQNSEGVGVACAEWADAHGIEWRQPSPVAPASSVVVSRGVSLVKITDGPSVPMILVLDSGRHGQHHATVTPFKINLIKNTGPWSHGACAWCCGDETVPASLIAESPIEGGGVWRDAMCAHHARVYGRFIPAHTLRAVACGGVFVEDWGFVESV